MKGKRAQPHRANVLIVPDKSSKEKTGPLETDIRQLALGTFPEITGNTTAIRNESGKNDTRVGQPEMSPESDISTGNSTHVLDGNSNLNSKTPGQKQEQEIRLGVDLRGNVTFETLQYLYTGSRLYTTPEPLISDVIHRKSRAPDAWESEIYDIINNIVIDIPVDMAEKERRNAFEAKKLSSKMGRNKKQRNAGKSRGPMDAFSRDLKPSEDLSFHYPGGGRGKSHPNQDTWEVKTLRKEESTVKLQQWKGLDPLSRIRNKFRARSRVGEKHSGPGPKTLDENPYHYTNMNPQPRRYWTENQEVYDRNIEELEWTAENTDTEVSPNVQYTTSYFDLFGDHSVMTPHSDIFNGPRGHAAPEPTLRPALELTETKRFESEVYKVPFSLRSQFSNVIEKLIIASKRES